MARENLYDVTDRDGKVIKAMATRKDVADITGFSARTVDEKLFRLVQGQSVIMHDYNVRLIIEKRLESPVNHQVKTYLEDGKWDRVCEPFRRLRKGK